MEKAAHDDVIWMLPPDKKHPKGQRVYRVSWNPNPSMGAHVVRVNDGHEFFVPTVHWLKAVKETKT